MSDGLNIAVIGAGIVGVSCGLFLLDDGHKVTLIDQAEPGTGTSFGNAGILSASSVLPIAKPSVIKQVPSMLMDRSSPLMMRWSYLPQMLPWLTRFLLASRPARVEQHARSIRALVSRAGQAHDVLIQRCGAGDLIRNEGWLKVAKSQATFEYATGLEREYLKKYDVPFDVLEGDAIRDFQPALAKDITHALYLKANRRVTDSLDYTQRLMANFVERGGRFLQQTVQGLQLWDGTFVLTDGGRQPFDRIIIAAGAFSKKLAAEAGHRVPLDTERGYHAMLPHLETPLSCSLQSLEHGFVLSPMRDGTRLTTSVELAGIKGTPDWRRVRHHASLVPDYLPGASTEIASEWLGYRPSLPDSQPVIGPSKQHPNVLFAFGHQHIGLTLGPLTGRIIADLVAGREPEIDLAPYDPDRLFF